MVPCKGMREIQLSPTLIGGSKEQPQYEENEAIPVYDTSGPYGDPQIAINVQQDVYKRQVRSARWFTLKVPKPTSCTASPSFRDSVIAARVDSRAALALSLIHI